jgi:hypothetical protein
MTSTIVFHPDVTDWYGTLTDDDRIRVQKRLDHLKANGPATRRPVVGTITGSRHANMKELICPNDIRILFAFDPDSQAVCLVGGTKTNQWTSWYKAAIPLADERFDEWLNSRA